MPRCRLPAPFAVIFPVQDACGSLLTLFRRRFPHNQLAVAKGLIHGVRKGGQAEGRILPRFPNRVFRALATARQVVRKRTSTYPNF